MNIVRHSISMGQQLVMNADIEFMIRINMMYNVNKPLNIMP